MRAATAGDKAAAISHGPRSASGSAASGYKSRFGSTASTTTPKEGAGDEAEANKCGYKTAGGDSRARSVKGEASGTAGTGGGGGGSADPSWGCVCTFCARWWAWTGNGDNGHGDGEGII